MTKKSIIITVSFILFTFVAAGFVFYKTRSQTTCNPALVAGGSSTIGGSFTLVNQFGQSVSEKDVIKDLSLVYFGYTFCPDVCPLDTARNLDAIDILNASGVKVDPIFITIDPARDTVKVMADYAEIMHPKLIALTGSEEQIAAVSKTYKTYRSKNGTAKDDYLMDHSTFSYLMSPNGMIDYFRREISPEDMAKKIECYAKILKK